MEIWVLSNVKKFHCQISERTKQIFEKILGWTCIDISFFMTHDSSDPSLHYSYLSNKRVGYNKRVG